MSIGKENRRITVLLGIYNGERYIQSLKEQIMSQTFQDFDLVVVDNASTDNSFQKLNAWKSDFGDRLSLHRNEENLGGGGSLCKALAENYVSTEWFATLHQDDFYLPNHLEAIWQALQETPANLVAVCTGMGSMDENGRTQTTPPRAAWLLNDTSTVSSFLINLRLQTLSFPSSAFKTKVFAECFRYWHSPAFSDTETTLYLCAYGDFRYVQTETMLYRENSFSESHVVNSLEASVSASISLSRVFTSQEFKAILQLVEPTKRTVFFSELLSAIELRIPNSPLTHFVKILAIEECSRVWKYQVGPVNLALSSIYDGLGSKFTSNLLGRLAEQEPVKATSDLEKALLELSDVKSAAYLMSASKSRSKLWSLVSHLPLPIRIKLFRAYVRIYAIKNPNHYWNSHWR
jgi:glycosyltransferase involved in cell wall biosynthesis